MDSATANVAPDVDPPLSEEEEAVTSRYRKLVKISVPKDVVRLKMEREGVGDRIAKAVLGKEEEEETDDGTVVGSSDAPAGDRRAVVPEKCVTDFGEWGAAVDPRCPTLAWEDLKDKLPPIEIVDVSRGDAPVHTGDRPRPDGYARFVCISDTHSLHSRTSVYFDVPGGDVLIHAGDFTRMGSIKEIKEFCEWMEGLPHEHKIVIAGNHELSLDDSLDAGQTKMTFIPEARELIRSCEAFTYLEDSSAKVLGYNVYGSPWQPEFCNWAFNLDRGPDCANKWKRIPSDTDVLVTHGPPVGHGDLCSNGFRAGCVDLLSEVLRRVKPSHHLYGHIHEGYGVSKMADTLFVNASTCTFRYRPSNPPLVFDLPPRRDERVASLE